MIRSRIGNWLYANISRSADFGDADRDAMIAQWPGDSAEPFSLVWFALVDLARRVFDDYSDPEVAEFGRRLTATLSRRRSIEESAVLATMLVALGDRSAALPDISTEDMFNVCVGACTMLASRVSEGVVETVVVTAEATAAAQGIDLP